MFPPPDSDPNPIHEARFRVFGSGDGGSRRSIVLGPAILERSVAVGPWTLAVREGGSLAPTSPPDSQPTSWPLARRLPCRLAFAIAVPGDFQRCRIRMAGRLLKGGRRGSRRPGFTATVLHMIYGWALAYRFPDSAGPALVDQHEDVPDLPAFYESPVELIDRIVHLEDRGIETRPIAVLVQPCDFTRDEHGGRINRYFPTPVRPGSKPHD